MIEVITALCVPVLLISMVFYFISLGRKNWRK